MESPKAKNKIFDSQRFDRAMGLFARSPQLALPFVAFSAAMILCLLVPGPARFGLNLFGKIAYNAVLTGGIFLYALCGLVLACVWQLRMLQQIEAGKMADAKTSFKQMLNARTFLIAKEMLLSSIWNFYPRMPRDLLVRPAQVRGLPAKSTLPVLIERERKLILDLSAPLDAAVISRNLPLIKKMEVSLAMTALVLNPNLPPKQGRKQGLEIARTHFRELEQFNDVPPVIPTMWVAIAGAVLLINFLLPESFMSSPAWFLYPALLVIGFSVYVSQMEWAEVYFRHKLWEVAKNEAVNRRQLLPTLNDISHSALASRAPKTLPSKKFG